MSNKKILSPYLNLNRLKNPKDDFKNCIKVLKKKTTLSEKKIIDIGCANGEFLDYFISKHPKNTYVGVDISPSFLKIAKKNIKGIFIHPFFWKIGLPLLRFISR